ncbi:MAG: hypothetical protein QME84_12375 [Actinomycetota bacterium]|nr:hypothetical protein [Actinomycetota bacterium]
MAKMQEPVQDGRGKGRIRKVLSPLPHPFVGGDDDRSFLVSRRDHLKEEVGFSRPHREVTHSSMMRREGEEKARMLLADAPVRESLSIISFKVVK